VRIYHEAFFELHLGFTRGHLYKPANNSKSNTALDQSLDYTVLPLILMLHVAFIGILLSDFLTSSV